MKCMLLVANKMPVVNGIESYGYLMLVLSMLPYLGKSPACEELMPWYPAVRYREHTRK